MEYHPGTDDYRVMAKAAIAAMREPTEAMLLAGSDDIHINEYRIYKSMIDAA